jgi:hypothetical protein
LALSSVPVDHGVAPPLPGRPRSQRAQIWLLVVEDYLGLVLGDREQQLLFAIREIMKKLAFGRLGARADVVECGDRDTAFAYLGGGALNDALSCRLALSRQILDLQVHF